MKKLAYFAISALLMLAATTSASDQRASAGQVKIDNFSFEPQVLTVPAGATVTWTNMDDVPHTVVNTEKKFASKVLDTDQQFSHTFTDAGTYEYYCSIHPHMTGKVIVK